MIDINEFRVLKFSFFSAEDAFDLRFGHEICWSRIYEYPFVLAELVAIPKKHLKIHNCSWGFRDMHVAFKTWLEISYPETIHSDIRPSTLYNTVVWDINSPPNESFVENYDAVINISTLEEVPTDHIQIMKNHLIQLRRGGRFIATFDVPGLQLEEIENYLGQKIVTPPNRLSPRNSQIEDKVLSLPDDFTSGYLVVERDG